MPVPTPKREITHKEFTKFKKPAWFVPTIGNHRIRLLQPLSEAHIQYVHWIARQRNYVNCLGEDTCPICLENKRIEMEHPETFTKEPGWNQVSVKYSINLYDRTLVKNCPKCEAENKMISSGAGQDFAPTCWSCNTSIISVVAEPSNTVKIISRHAPLFTDGFETLEKTVLDLEGNSIPLTSYDISLNVTKKERGYNIMPVPQTHLNDKLDITEEDLFDLEDAIIKLEPDEVIQFLRGVSLKDIFSARNAEENVKKEKSEETEMAEEDALVSAQDKVKNLFGGIG